jgi:subtilisin family serine protease
MATVRSGDAISALSRVARDGRGAGLIDPAASHVIFSLNGDALVQVQLAPNADPAAAARWLATQRGVVWTAPNTLFQGEATDFTPNDPQYPSQYHLPKMQLPAGWDTQTGDPAIVLAICDLGTAYNHPDLYLNIWTNSGEIPSNGVDDEGNGFIDDVHG